ncbi:uncharacterized protein LOC9312718 [Arabidopsis lyrata subsp. lyrata]|uniref:uncharacterized protein LOC9312718 n=1 Tax=Arabidopsis lyrata subsp. lyrata TaxID=81972 RepID=UPI000A29BBC1|nr:uncharacterized protein LOC9312718 [Arabidopsis lyrata subsp. lyrata]XP_020880849.1 uncharacterized protein LOC9312718 [Arabidopsis lyrata subsp. lyrata]XP_020880850.1 uncharacterized protein LOC9312718 [Arabidopsis lyrata subsp. lyrata]|eukprot:XP_020880848.1 uncharacterized protein LOC9312718 [Arabidopsis lyrata subsp. lyrata]
MVWRTSLGFLSIIVASLIRIYRRCRCEGKWCKIFISLVEACSVFHVEDRLLVRLWTVWRRKESTCFLCLVVAELMLVPMLYTQYICLIPESLHLETKYSVISVCTFNKRFGL